MPKKPAVAVLLALLLGCGDITPPPDGFGYAQAMFRCGPADGPTTAIVLARGPLFPPSLNPVFVPNVWIVIDRSLAQVEGTWNVGDAALNAVYYPQSQTYETATLGRVTVDRVLADKTIVGSVELRFPSRTVTGSFNATWFESQETCG
jgi:hypothetical protein